MKPLRVGILGGGPAGLYAAVLLKNANPDNDVFVIERNPAGATYGFGIVVSDKTLTHFREADQKVFDEITAHQVTWDSIEIHHRGERVRCGGYFYLGMPRKKLLDILLARCEELGVRLEHQRDLADLSPFAGCDLILAADGVNSLTRRLYAEHFKPTIRPGEGRFVWLATRWHAPGFSFIFHETEHGIFQAHMYPYDQDTSTCIVMCHESTWRKHGLDQLDEAGSAAFCKELYRPYIGDVEFLTNRSLWAQFNEVKNEHWYHGNIVLLGDAVHTAHWSIGSGTKLAMEDAITLVDSLQRFDEIPAALAHYERERKLVAEKIQKAARISQAYCENIERYAHLEPMQFGFQFMVRSGRVDYETLKQKDPDFIAAVERWFAEKAAAVAGGAAREAMEPVQSPLKLRSVILGNRVVQVGSGAARPEGLAPGLVLTSAVAAPVPEAVQTWRQLVDNIHAGGGARAALQLGDGGARAADSPAADLALARAEFVRAAELANAAGFDLLQLHMAGGSLCEGLLSAGNSRSDAYGGSPENRMRFPLELVAAVRAVWPADKPLAVTLTAANGTGAGLGMDEAMAFAGALKEQGCDLIHFVADGEGPRAEAAALAASEQVRNLVRIATMAGGKATCRSEANTAVAGARADLCVMAVL